MKPPPSLLTPSCWNHCKYFISTQSSEKHSHVKLTLYFLIQRQFNLFEKVFLKNAYLLLHNIQKGFWNEHWKAHGSWWTLKARYQFFLSYFSLPNSKNSSHFKVENLCSIFYTSFVIIALRTQAHLVTITTKVISSISILYIRQGKSKHVVRLC